MGYFTTAYNIYNVLLTISTAGLPVALSKMVSEANTLGLHNQKRRTFHVAFLTFFILGFAGTLVMACFPKQLAEMMNNAQAWYAIIALSPAVIGVCCMSAFRGYTQGQTNMVPTAVSQVIEATSKLVLGLIFAIGMLNRGFNTAEAAGGTILGISIGSLLGLIYLIAHHMIHRKQYNVSSPDVSPSRRKLLQRIVQLGIPIMLGSSVLSIITMGDAKLIYYRLQTSAGYTEEAANWIYGVYSSTMTLYNLPAALIVPLTTSIIPAMTA
jgi:stage V sporulation protein B